MNYQIILENAAQRDLSRIHGNIYTRICRAIDALANNPRPLGCIKLTVQNQWRIRVGRYRIIYEVDDNAQMVIVKRIGHRRDVYRER